MKTIWIQLCGIAIILMAQSYQLMLQAKQISKMVEILALMNGVKL